MNAHASAIMLRPFVRLHLCPPVRPTHSDMVSKRLNILTIFFHCRIAPLVILPFLTRKLCYHKDDRAMWPLRYV